MIVKHNKLVRDKIPEIIQTEGKKAIYEIMKRDQYIEALDRKLLEEANEFIDDHSVEEMADVMEVVLALIKLHGFSIEEVEIVRRKKQEKRGSFEKRIFLKVVEE